MEEDYFSMYYKLDTWEDKKKFMEQLRSAKGTDNQLFTLLNKYYWREYWQREEDLENGFCPDCHQRLSNNGAPHTCIYF